MLIILILRLGGLSVTGNYLQNEKAFAYYLLPIAYWKHVRRNHHTARITEELHMVGSCAFIRVG